MTPTSERERAEFEKCVPPNRRLVAMEAYDAGAEAARREERQRCVEIASKYMWPAEVTHFLSVLDKETA